jgi:hypothetical protein
VLVVMQTALLHSPFVRGSVESKVQDEGGMSGTSARIYYGGGTGSHLLSRIMPCQVDHMKLSMVHSQSTGEAGNPHGAPHAF